MSHRRNRVFDEALLGRRVLLGDYLQLQNKWPFCNRKSSFVRDNSPLSLHFQSKISKQLAFMLQFAVQSNRWRRCCWCRRRGCHNPRSCTCNQREIYQSPACIYEDSIEHVRHHIRPKIVKQRLINTPIVDPFSTVRGDVLNRRPRNILQQDDSEQISRTCRRLIDQQALT